MENTEQSLQRRTFERAIVNMDVRFFFGNMFYSGTATDISENGMFIRTRKSLPADSLFPLIVRKEGGLLIVMARVKWLATADGAYSGMGIHILHPSRNYLELILRLKATAAS